MTDFIESLIALDTVSSDIATYAATGKAGVRIAPRSADEGITDHFADYVMKELQDAIDEMPDGPKKDEIMEYLGDLHDIRQLNNPSYPRWVREMFDNAAKSARPMQNEGSSATIPIKTMSQSSAHLGFLLLDKGEVPGVEILQEATRENNGVMKLKVPFYVGNSISQASGIDKKIFFGADKLPGLIQRVNAFIAEKRQPITVYPRHAHALDGSHLPVGIVSEVKSDGRVGYAIMDIAPTTEGRDVQVLAHRKMLNAVSLRSNGDQFVLQDAVVNEEEVFDVDLQLIAGIDFAPDGPAMPTYGIEVLAAEASVVRNTSKEASVGEPVEITLEAVKAKSELVAAIEKPVRDELAAVQGKYDTLLTEHSALKEKADAAEREAHLKELASKFPKPEEALIVITAEAEGLKSVAEIDAKIMPLVLDVLTKQKLVVQQAAPKENPFLKFFPSSGGSGQVITQEGVQQPVGETVSGLPIPE